MRASTLTAVVAVLLLSACPPAGVRGTARTLPRGETRLYAAVGPTFGFTPMADANGALTRAWWMAAAYDAGLHYGFLDDLEGGVGIWSGGSPNLPNLSATVRARLLSPERWPLPVHVTLAPAITFPAAYVDLPLLVGVDVAGDDELLLAPKASWRLDENTLRHPTPTFVGGSIGYAFRLPRHGLVVKPELGVLYSLRYVSELFIATPYVITQQGDWRWSLGVELSTLPNPRR